jgi:cyclic beta-1,2-glucan synthetase
VIANANFGTLVTASGSAFTWAENSRENRLTRFANDPVTDPTSEALFLRDEETGRVWGATPGVPRRNPKGPRFVVRHGAGVTTLHHARFGIEHELSYFIAPDAPVRVALLALTNRSSQPRRLGLFAYNEWQLGPPRAGSHEHVTTEWDPERRAIFARNPYSDEFQGRVAFLASSERPRSATGDRVEFLGRNGTLGDPAALKRVSLGGGFGAGLDPCAAMQVEVEIDPGETRHVVFVLGEGQDLDRARALAERFAAVDCARDTLQKARAAWDEILGTIEVRTPDDSFDVLMNRWLLYQCLSARF